MIRALVSWSGGKDSAWTLELLRRRSDVEVAGLFTTVHRESAKVAVHGVPLALLEAQARAAGLPVRELDIPANCPNPVYERAVGELVAQAKAEGVTHLAFGDLFLEDIRRYRERQFAASGVELLFPLWGADTGRLARDMTGRGLRAWITCVDTEQAPAAWAGCLFDKRFVDEVPAGIDPCGENGEFHTFVVEGPMLRGRVDARVAGVRREGRWAYADLEKGSEQFSCNT
ncbi:MAG TPA: ATP-binding protein [Burkholderiales bacterium]|nr:ATP-binding protein [Burkholderiales bacterium]